MECCYLSVPLFILRKAPLHSSSVNTVSCFTGVLNFCHVLPWACLFPCTTCSMYRQLGALCLHEPVNLVLSLGLKILGRGILFLNVQSQQHYWESKSICCKLSTFYTGYLLWCHHFRWYWLYASDLRTRKCKYSFTWLFFAAFNLPFINDRI